MTTPTPTKPNKFHFYFGKRTNAVILCSFFKGYRLYFWDTTKNTITKGQWLINGKISTTKCRVSEDCTYFEYKLNQHDDNRPLNYRVISISPYFTAIWIDGLCSDMGPKRGKKPIVKCWTEMISADNATQTHGFQINKEHTILTKNNVILLDVTGDTFHPITPPYESV